MADTNSSHSQPIEGFEIPLYLALTQPPLFGGVPREFGILTLVISLVVTVGLHLWWIGLPLGLALHGVTVALTRRDPQWLQIFRAHLKQPSFLDW